MSTSLRYLSGALTLLTIGTVVSTSAPFNSYTPALAQESAPESAPAANFPDIQNHWARPFIEALAEKDIVAGYPDGTFQPERAVKRDELAAIIRQAFDEKPIRQIESGSAYKDVPSGYWGAPGIEQAYQTGFMNGYPGGLFRPRQEVSRVEAIVALNRGTNLPADTPTATTEKTTTQTTTSEATAPVPAAPTQTPQARRRAARKPLFIPLAMTSMMQPLLIAAANAQAIPAPTDAPSPEASPPPAKEQEVSADRPASVILSEYYTDAQSIPQYAVGSVAEATTANVVVNYPNLRVLNPNQPASRGDIAAFMHQALVAQGRIEPLPGEIDSSKYIVGRDRAQGN